MLLEYKISFKVLIQQMFLAFDFPLYVYAQGLDCVQGFRDLGNQSFQTVEDL